MNLNNLRRRRAIAAITTEDRTLNDMLAKDLKKIASDLKIKGYGRMSKADLIANIEKIQASL